MKMIRAAVIATALATPALASQAAPANLGYDFIEFNAGIGKLGVEAAAFREDLRTKNFSARWSGMISDNLYSTLNLARLSGDGDETYSNNRYELVTRQTNYSVLVGGAFGIGETMDIFAGLGIGGFKQHSRLDVSNPQGEESTDLDTRKTSLAWEVGLRKQFWKNGLELEARAHGIGEQQNVDFNLPFYLSDEISISPWVSLMQEDRIKINKSHAVFGLGLRINY